MTTYRLERLQSASFYEQPGEVERARLMERAAIEDLISEHLDAIEVTGSFDRGQFGALTSLRMAIARQEHLPAPRPGHDWPELS